MAKIELLLGDCLEKLKELEDNSIDSVVTDPPYEIGFMGKGWDDSGIANNPQLWKEVLRVLKPGGHLLSFSHSRTYHRQAVAVEDAGFEIRDQIMWIYGSGFPKSHDVGKNIEKIKVGGKANLRQVGTKPGLVATNHNDKAKTSNPSGFSYRTNQKGYSEVATDRTQVNGDIPVYEITNEYKGWGTALKPAHEPIVMARKPFKGNVAQNVLEWGTGGINVDGCRIGYRDEADEKSSIPGSNVVNQKNSMFGINGETYEHNTEGRFPANIIFGHNPDCKLVGYDEEIVIGGNKGKSGFANGYEKGDFTKEVKKVEKWECTDGCAVKLLDEQSGVTKSSKRGVHNNKKTEHTNTYTPPQAMYSDENTYGDSGGASRFFYCPKANKSDRNEGCDALEEKKSRKWRDDKGMKLTGSGNPRNEMSRNIHPTVKPTALMTYLIRLVTPKGGLVLDPFMGSGSTGKAAVREGMDFIGIEREEEYMEIAKSRIEYEQKKNKHSEFFSI